MTPTAHTTTSAVTAKNGPELHFSFVEMLFALAIAQVAIGVADLIQDDWDYLPAYFHLLLAIIVITTSWVGWRQSAFSGSKVKTIFGRDFIELMLDVLLVIFYFILARGVESPHENKNMTVPAENEAFWVMVIMISYFVWDCVSKWGEENQFYEGWKSKELIQRGWASFAAAGLASGHQLLLSVSAAFTRVPPGYILRSLIVKSRYFVSRDQTGQTPPFGPDRERRKVGVDYNLRSLMVGLWRFCPSFCKGHHIDSRIAGLIAALTKIDRVAARSNSNPRAPKRYPLAAPYFHARYAIKPGAVRRASSSIVKRGVWR